MLLDRVATEPRDVVGRLVGLQAQDPDPPYVGLWCRVAGFAHNDLTTALERRDVVRADARSVAAHRVRPPVR